MENQKNNKGVIALLIVIIVILSVLCVLFATGTISFKSNDVDNNEINQNINENDNDKTNDVNNKRYLKGETVTLKDNSKWLVLADSDENSEVIKLMNINDFILYGSSCKNQDEYIYCDDDSDYTALVNEYFNSSTTYKGSKIESLINSYASLIPAKLKEVDGYKIRLLSINDIFEYDNNWKKIEGNEYIYTGNSFNDNFTGAWTMDTVESRCTGNCGNFFVVRKDYNYDTNEIEKIYLGMGYSGLAELKPVIYVLKSSI